MELSSSQKGGLAELKIAAEAADLGIDVYRPMIDGPVAISSSTSGTGSCGSSASGPRATGS
jgi:hypothetical protein